MMNEDVATSGRDAGFTLADLDYVLPDGLIAQNPLPRRDGARLLVLDRATGGLRDGRIVELPEVLKPGDLLVLNDTKVLPARFTARRLTGGQVGGLFVQEEGPGEWRVMLAKSRRLRVGESLTVGSERTGVIRLKLLEAYGAGSFRVGVEPEGSAEQILDNIGKTPLPPYIHRNGSDAAKDVDDRSRYQTVYADRPGAVAAPTAGLHLTHALLNKIRARGVEIALVTLHVGVGTFSPIRVEQVSQHAMHAEWYELKKGVAGAVRRCRKRGGRVVAVGTTSVRVLESAAMGYAGRLGAPGLQTWGSTSASGIESPTSEEMGHPLESAAMVHPDRTVRPFSGMTDVFIYPPYRFRVVDALLTNFHLPGSTLLALVMALAGVENTRRAYQHAIELGYRFYSYGDAMLIQ